MSNSRNIRKRTILMVLLTALICLLCCFAAFGEEAMESEAPGTELNVLDFGAVPDDGQDDTEQINKALDAARVRYEKTNQQITVVIPGGTYNVSDVLYIFSHTTLTAKSGAVIRSSYDQASILVGAHMTPDGKRRCPGDLCTDHGFGYSKNESIIVEGGTWIAGPSSSDGSPGCIAIRHARNITIRNLTCKNASGHAVNLSGVDGGTVYNVTFQDGKEVVYSPSTSYHREAIHLDYCNEEGEPTAGLPYDDTPAKNITVEKCRFINMYAGVGNHHTLPAGGTISSNITVKNCTFTNMKAFAVCESSVKELKMLNNTATETPVLLYLTFSNNCTISGNSVDAGGHTYPYIEGKEGKDYTEIYIDQCHDVTVEKNTVKNTVYAGIKAYSTSGGMDLNRVTISDNILSGIKATGIDVQLGTGNIISGNELSGVGNNGIYVRCLKDSEVSGNTVSCEDGSAVYVSGVEENPCEVTIRGNTLSSAKAYDIYLSTYADCGIQKNTLKNNTFYWTNLAKYTSDFPKIKTVKLNKTKFTYTGEEIHPKITVKDADGHLLVEGLDYTVGYIRCVRAGDAGTMIRVSGTPRGMYAGQEIEKKFKIQPKPVKKLKIVLSEDTYNYDGGKKRPTVKVYDGKTLIEPKNYKVTYDKETASAGEHTVKVTLKKNYSGSGKATYTIKPQKVKNLKIKLAATSYVYTGKPIQPKAWAFAGSKRIPANSLSVEYPEDCVNVGTHTVTVKLIHNYSGKATADFEITPARQTMKVKKKTAPVSVNAAKKAQTVEISEILDITDVVGELTFKMTDGSDSVKVDKETGLITIAKGAKKGKHAVYLEITAAGTKNYQSKTEKISFSITVK